jgi:RHS repeat-associated protein
VIAGFQYTRDSVGNPTGVSLADGNLITFTHDDNYRLTREQRSGTGAYDITYTFDAVGNRTAKLTGGVTTTYSFNEADQLTLEDAGGTLTTYSFDAAGNNTVVNANGTRTTYAWDLANRLAGVADGSGLTTLVYDATGLRRGKQDASGTTRFLWDGQTLLLETDAGGTTQAHYTAAPGGYGPLVAQRRATTSRFYHPTDLGTIENLTDASGDVTDTYVLDAWGRETASSGSTTNPHRYVGSLGYQTDPTLGLTYVRARYLRPSTGSWLSVDPVEGEPRYLYVGDSPVQRVDASGLGANDPPGMVCGWVVNPKTGSRIWGCMSEGTFGDIERQGNCLGGWGDVTDIINATLRDMVDIHPGMTPEEIVNHPGFWGEVEARLARKCEEAKRRRRVTHRTCVVSSSGGPGWIGGPVDRLVHYLRVCRVVVVGGGGGDDGATVPIPYEDPPGEFDPQPTADVIPLGKSRDQMLNDAIAGGASLTPPDGSVPFTWRRQVHPAEENFPYGLSPPNPVPVGPVPGDMWKR